MLIDLAMAATLSNLQILRLSSRSLSTSFLGRRFIEIIRSKEFTAAKAWGSRSIATMNGITTKLHWTDQPYHWHINDGQEIFAVLDGSVDMFYKKEGKEQMTTLATGDIFYASVGTEHVAYPQGEARILVIESQDSV
ncbi:MAG: mannose-6-phosphate isomerase-like protein (cupin superfamily) [Cellvibrionaceae bacterium]